MAFCIKDPSCLKDRGNTVPLCHLAPWFFAAESMGTLVVIVVTDQEALLPPTITLGVVTWRLGIMLRRSGASFLVHLSPLQSVHHPGKGRKINLKYGKYKADKAAGIMWLMVEPTQRVHFRGIKDDAVKMWGVLEGVHMQKQPGTWFNAYDDLFSI